MRESSHVRVVAIVEACKARQNITCEEEDDQKPGLEIPSDQKRPRKHCRSFTRQRRGLKGAERSVAILKFQTGLSAL